MGIEVSFSAAKSPATGGKTGQDAWDYLFGWINPGQTNKLGLPVLKQRVLERAAGIIESSINAILIPAIQKKLEENESVFRGDLKDSFFTIRSKEGSVSLLSDVPYAGLVERGSDARTISGEERNNIFEWALFKYPDQDPQATTDAVVAAIQKKGNNEHPYIAPALAETEDHLLQHIEIQLR